MIPSVNGFAGAVDPVDPAQRLDREAAARVLATLSAKGTADDQLAALLERSFRAALLDALSQIPERPAQSPVTPPPKASSIPAQTSSSPADGRPLQDQQGPASVPAAENADQGRGVTGCVDPRFLGALRAVLGGVHPLLLEPLCTGGSGQRSGWVENQHHARNLTRLYAQAASSSG